MRRGAGRRAEAARCAAGRKRAVAPVGPRRSRSPGIRRRASSTDTFSAGARRRRARRTMRSTSWRRAARRWSRRPTGRSRSCSSAAAAAGSPPMSARPTGAWIYYYAHLDAYAPGLREGQRVAPRRSDRPVGSTGNANPAGPHLHFAIHRMAPGRALVAGPGDQSLSAPCRAAARAAKARANLSQSSEHRHEDQRRGHSSRQHHRI